MNVVACTHVQCMFVYRVRYDENILPFMTMVLRAQFNFYNGVVPKLDPIVIKTPVCCTS